MRRRRISRHLAARLAQESNSLPEAYVIENKCLYRGALTDPSKRGANAMVYSSMYVGRLNESVNAQKLAVKELNIGMNEDTKVSFGATVCRPSYEGPLANDSRVDQLHDRPPSMRLASRWIPA